VSEGPNTLRNVSRELLTVLADEDRPMSLRDLESTGRLDDGEAARQLSVARVAGFVRALPSAVGSGAEPAYQPTPLGYMVARRSHAFAAAQQERALLAARRLDRRAA
jgi:hypothetical protein